MPWQPTAPLPVLVKRAELYQQIRFFFQQRQVLEVDVPVLSPYATIDPFIDSLKTSVMGCTHYLQTSPEFYLKRCLAAYPNQDIYYLGKAFRQGEKGLGHQPEFTMLEWYRVSWNERQLINEVFELLQCFFPEKEVCCVRYSELFLEHLHLNPHTATAPELEACARSRVDTGLDVNDKNPWLDILFTHCIEPELPAGIVAIYDYPASQAALARIAIDQEGYPVAKRFEIYVDGLELANGYWELRDANEHEARFKADDQYRQQYNLPTLPYDQLLLDAIHEGRFPECAGVALGVDRLLMRLLQVKEITQIMSFGQ